MVVESGRNAFVQRVEISENIIKKSILLYWCRRAGRVWLLISLRIIYPENGQRFKKRAATNHKKKIMRWKYWFSRHCSTSRLNNKYHRQWSSLEALNRIELWNISGAYLSSHRDRALRYASYFPPSHLGSIEANCEFPPARVGGNFVSKRSRIDSLTIWLEVGIQKEVAGLHRLRDEQRAICISGNFEVALLIWRRYHLQIQLCRLLERFQGSQKDVVLSVEINL